MFFRMFYVVVSNVRSLHNVGSLFRTSDAFGVEKIILGGYTGYPPHKEITKTALGAEQWVKWEKHYHLGKKLLELKKEGFSLIGLENNIEGTIPLEEFIPSFPLALIVGNEVRGISKSIQKKIDAFVSIPMRGKKESLNVAVAFGIAAYHIASLKFKTKN